jgi:anaerobic magnesium-protoporphyrin IX monomethyl ester cyclase
MKVLFTHSYFLQFDEKQVELSKPYPPLGTINAASYLRSKEYEVELFDTNFSKSAKEILPFLEDSNLPDILVIYDDGFNYLTKMCLTNMREAAFEMIKFAKGKNIPVIVSSSDSTDNYVEYLSKGADVVILGEAEATLLDVVNNLKNERPFNEVDGIAYKTEVKTIKTTPRKILTELDALPLPAWDLVDIKPYKKAWSKHGYFSINLATTRGCPYKCNWCAKPIYGQRYNSRSAKHVVSEIKLIQSLFSFDHIWFGDDIFGLKPEWVQNFNEELKVNNLSIRYKIQSRADLLLKDNTIKVLADSGCEEVWIGAESGSQKVLDDMDKGTLVSQIEESTQLMKNYGIKPCYFLQFGYLEETWEDIKKTLSLLFEQMPHDIGVSVSYPLPGTPFYDRVKSQLGTKSNWEDSDELLLMYKSTFSAKFYKKLHRFIHKRFRQKQAWSAIKNGNLSKFLHFGYFKLMSNSLFVQVLILKRE